MYLMAVKLRAGLETEEATSHSLLKQTSCVMFAHIVRIALTRLAKFIIADVR